MSKWVIVGDYSNQQVFIPADIPEGRNPYFVWRGPYNGERFGAKEFDTEEGAYAYMARWAMSGEDWLGVVRNPRVKQVRE